MLPGVKVSEITKHPDERGSFSEIFRQDWPNFIETDDKILQANLSYSHPGIIRAWHKHLRGQVDYFITIKGTIKICAYDDKEDSATRGQLDEIISTGDKLQCVRIPGFYYHGYKVMGKEPALLVYLTTRLYDYKNPDEPRIAWDDPSVIDPQTKKPYDWNALPHK
ncbi:MAG: dTDP-4-dehydrorhamnose 3,5-epimerase family protein [Nitrosopumilaceae archaeon]